MAIKKEKNLVSSRSEYTSYYGDFRGVDFSSDHTQVRENRLAYSLNMYKDYRSKNGTAIETIPGFRRQFQASDGSEIYAIHRMKTKVGDVMLVHAGKKLYVWENYPNTCGVLFKVVVRLGAYEMVGGYRMFTLDLSKIAAENGGSIGEGATFASYSYPSVYGTFQTITKSFTISSSELSEGDPVVVEYYESTPTEVQIFDPTLATEDKVSLVMNDRKSRSFTIGETLFIMDGKNFLEVKMENGSIVCSSVVDAPPPTSATAEQYGKSYIPTRFINVGDYNSDKGSGEEYEQRNLCGKYCKCTYTDGRQFPIKEKNIDTDNGLIIVELYGGVHLNQVDPDSEDIGWIIYTDNGVKYILLTKNASEILEKWALHTPPDGEPYVTVLFEYSDVQEARRYVETSTITCTFDNRIFLSGIHDSPKLVHYSKPFSSPTDPIFFGEDDRSIVGMGSTDPITALMPVANTLMVLGSGDGNKGSISFLTPVQTGNDVVAKAYTEEHGLFGTGCVGAYANFYDDPVFLSKRGLDAIGTLSTRLERAVEHRSSLVDSYLANADLDNAFIAEWGGYLLVFVNGAVFMADSRQRYTDSIGIVQYEWYYLDGIGVYDGQELDAEGIMQGGEFKPASCAYSTGDDLYFGTKNGVVCKFNFDKRDEYGEIPINYYTFDGRTIKSGCATKMDNCGIPHLTKSTVKKSLVIKTKTLGGSVIKVKVRTNRDPFNQVTKIASTPFSFEDLSFEDLSFETSESSVFAVKEKQKKWIEKQLYLYSDEHMRPFALYYIAYRYFIAGRYKET